MCNGWGGGSLCKLPEIILNLTYACQHNILGISVLYSFRWVRVMLWKFPGNVSILTHSSQNHGFSMGAIDVSK